MKNIKIGALQADIIYKALYYTAKNEGLQLTDEQEETGRILAEEDPANTCLADVLDIMDMLQELIQNDETYAEYFTSEEYEIN